MSTGIAALQTELERWEAELDRLSDTIGTNGHSREHLLAATQQTIAAYRRRILPRIQAEHDLALPALPDAARGLAAYDAVVIAELSRLVRHLDDLRNELFTAASLAHTQQEIGETLASLRTLGRVLVRFGHDTEIPTLLEHLDEHQSRQLAGAVERYERSMR